MMKPIPRELLIHEATMKSVTSVDRWGNETWAAPVELRFIRLEPFWKTVVDKQNTQVQRNCTLFYDCKNSLPIGITFTKDMVITVNGLDYRIQEIEDLYDEKKLHHYEIGLV